MFLREKEFKALRILGENFFRKALGRWRSGKSFCKEAIAGPRDFKETRPSEGYRMFDNIVAAWECRFDEWVMRPRWLRVKEYALMMQEAHGVTEKI